MISSKVSTKQDDQDELETISQDLELKSCNRIAERRNRGESTKSTKSTTPDTSPGVLYYIKFQHKFTSSSGTVTVTKIGYKIGITHNLNKRFTKKERNDLNIELIWGMRGPYNEMYGLEQMYHRKYQNYRYQHKDVFSNSTECYTFDVLEKDTHERVS